MIWETVKLGDVCDLQNGFAFKSNLFKEDGLPILRISNIQEDIISLEKLVYFSENDYSIDFERYKVHQNDLLIAMSGATTGKLGFNQSGKTFYLNQRVGKFLPHKTLNKKYLYYILSTKVEENLNISRGAAQPNLSTKQIKDIEFFLPPLAEQNRIVAKLDATFADIDRTIEALESKKQEANKLKALLLSEKLCFTSHEKIKIGDVLKTSAGGTPLKSHKEYYENGDINWLLSGAVNKQNIIKCKTHITQQGLQNSSAKVFPINTVLVAMYGATAGQVGILRIEAATNQAVCGIYPSSEYLPEFLYFYLENYKKTLLEEASGTAQPNISQIKIKNVPLPVISISDQQEIISLVETIFLNLKKFTITLDKSKDNYVSLKSAILVQELQSSEAA